MLAKIDKKKTYVEYYDLLSFVYSNNSIYVRGISKNYNRGRGWNEKGH